MLKSLRNIHVKIPLKKECIHAKRLTEGKCHKKNNPRDFISIQVLPTAPCVEYSK
jgi:hypothetical protein